MPYRTLRDGVLPRVTEVVSAPHCEAAAWIPQHLPADRPQVAHYGQILGKIVHHNIATQLGTQHGQAQPPIDFTPVEREILQREYARPADMKRLEDDVTLCMTAFSLFRAKYRFEPIWVERGVISRAHGYAGTMDLMARVWLQGTVMDAVTCQFIPNPAAEPRWVVTILDWKTSKEPSLDYARQGTAYWLAADEMGLFDPFRKQQYAINHQTWAVLLGAERFLEKSGYILAVSAIDKADWLETLDFFREVQTKAKPTTANKSGVEGYHQRCMICGDIPNCPDRATGPGKENPLLRLD